MFFGHVVVFKCYSFSISQQVNYEKNIFLSENSKFIGSKVSSLSLMSGGEDLEVSGLEHPIEIKLENQEDLLEGTTIEFFIPGYLVTHTVQLQSTDCILMLHVEPPDDLDKGTLLNVLVQYAKPPTLMVWCYFYLNFFLVPIRKMVRKIFLLYFTYVCTA